ncbi:unnamed protein product [Calypogeia fissa]
MHEVVLLRDRIDCSLDSVNKLQEEMAEWLENCKAEEERESQQAKEEERHFKVYEKQEDELEAQDVVRKEWVLRDLVEPQSSIAGIRRRREELGQLLHQKQQRLCELKQ